MKKIENKVTSLPNWKDKTMNYGDLIKSCISIPWKDGYWLEEMKILLAVSNKIEKDVKEFEFENQEFNKIKEKVEAMKRLVFDKDIIDFLEYIQSIK